MSNEPLPTSLIFPTTGLLVGSGSTFNLAGNYFDFKYSKTGEEADCKAIASDWNITAKDIAEAIESIHWDEIETIK